MIRSPLAIGEAISAFTLPDQDGVVVSVPLGEPTVLLFFRGQW